MELSKEVKGETMLNKSSVSRKGWYFKEVDLLDLEGKGVQDEQDTKLFNAKSHMLDLTKAIFTRSLAFIEVENHCRRLDLLCSIRIKGKVFEEETYVKYLHFFKKVSSSWMLNKAVDPQ